MKPRAGRWFYQNPEDILSKGFTRTDFTDQDVVLIIRPGHLDDIQAVAKMLDEMIEAMELSNRTLH